VLKDTARNLLATGEAVVHIAHLPLAAKMVETSAEVPPEIDEFELAGLTKIASRVVKPFRIAEAAIAFETRMVHHQEVGNGPVDLFLLEIVHFHLADEFVVNGLPDAAKLQAVARCGGIQYCATERIFELDRP
jgi:flavin reductase (DIM6/NTAB) family NADH-FMN oxidoreductase RutF